MELITKEDLKLVIGKYFQIKPISFIFRATLVSDIHRAADAVAEKRKGDKAIGTTLQGIGPSYASKILRFGLRVGDLVDWPSF